MGLLRADIAQAGGWISFHQYMHTALYAPQWGYYSGGATKLGEAGDFVTAPELTPLFAQALARQVAQVLKACGGDVVELGAGSGALARDLLTALDEFGALPRRYLILDVSGQLIQRQRHVLAPLPAHLRERVAWIDEMPCEIEGVMLANEVLDALPVHLVCWHADRILERGVTAAEDGFAFCDQPIANRPLLASAERIKVPTPYVSEIHLPALALTRQIARCMRRGVVLLIDYGFGASEYYHPQRAQGTLMCHYRHRAHADPFFLPGLQDITAHVNFSAIAEVAVQAGMSLAGYVTQARCLTNLGITQLLAHADPNSAHYARLVAPVQKLLSPAEMGELFKVLALTKDFDQPLLGFTAGDLSRLL